jgi:predicted metalloprotease with PDZ domain
MIVPQRDELLALGQVTPSRARYSLRTLALAVTAGASLASLSMRSVEAAPSEPLPSLRLTLTPREADGAVAYIDATLVISAPNLSRGQALLEMPLIVASIPTQRYDGDALTATDASGALPLTQKDAAPQSFETLRDWQVTRATSGAVTVRFRAVPRQVDAGTRPGPLFDLRAENGGLSGAGLAFLPYPTGGKRYRLQLHWDIRGLSAPDRVVSCLADGDASLVGTPEALTECYYAVGPLQVYPPGRDPKRKFGIYWLTPTPFDVPEAAAQIQTLFTYMAAFFHDAGGSYRVFIRKNPYASGGGTTLRRSFMFGWGERRVTTVDGLEGLLSHEMTHNWPALEGSHGDTSWYSEGTAEYYSILLSWRSGAIDAAEFLKRINQRARGYYQNPLQRLTLHQAEERYWQESDASYVPYGRGFMYLAQVDAEIRAKSGGKRRLDDLVVALVDRARRGESYTLNDWVRMITDELGPQARAEFEAMVAGKRLVPPENAFAPCFRRVRSEVRLTDLGFDESSLTGAQKIIHGLRPDSSAARAGLRDGDHIVRRTLTDQDEPNRPMTLTVRRDGIEKSIAFAPLGKRVEAYQWARVPSVTPSGCRY